MAATGSDFTLGAHPTLAKGLPVCVAILDGYGENEFKDEWKHKRTLVDEEITHIQQAVRERADAQRHFLEKKYGKERIPSVKYSTFTRDMIKQAMAPIP